ncbi:hypothetical protein GPALN_005736 [Globodera pallida]|nr:hypothetical protein GPALN_005736 [Globodera pallida]
MITIICLFLIFISCTSCKFNLEMKTEEFDVKYLQLFKMSSDNNKQKDKKNSSENKIYEKSKLGLEASMFNAYVLNFFNSVNMTKLNESQKNLLQQKMSKYKEIITKFTRSAENNCELWKFFRKLCCRNVSQSLPTIYHDKFEQVDEEIDLNEIECVEMEEIVKKFNNNKNISNSIEEKLDYFPILIREYVNDCRLAHINAIQTLLNPLNEQGQPSRHAWKFMEFFDDKRIKNETKFAYNLRMMGKKCREQKKCEEIIEFKVAFRELVGRSWPLLEWLDPLTMAFDIIDDEQLALDYVIIFRSNPFNPSNAEIIVSSRAYFAKILEIFSKISHLNQSNQKPKFHIQYAKKWEKALKIFVELREMSSTRFIFLYGFWHKLALLYNKIPALQQNERVTVLDVDECRAEQYEMHVKNMLRFYEKGNNPFSNFLEQCELDDQGHKFLVQQFYVNGISDEPNNCFGKLQSKYPKLKKMLRFDLNDEQITQIQIRNYLKFMNIETNEGTWKRGKYLLNILVYYHWFKRNMNILPIIKRKMLDDEMAEFEILMNGANQMSNENIEGSEQEALILSHLFELKNQFFHVGKKAAKMPQNLCDNMEEDNSLLSLFHLHEVAISELFGNNEFTEQLKNIYIDQSRLTNIIGANSEIFKRLLMESNYYAVVAAQNVATDKDESADDIDEINSIEIIVDQNSKLIQKDGGLLFDEYLMHFYQQIMAKESEISEAIKKEIEINAIYFLHKSIIIDIITEMENLLKKQKTPNEALKAIFTKLKLEADIQWRLYSTPVDNDEKQRTICLIKIFMNSFLDTTKTEEPLNRSEILAKVQLFKTQTDLDPTQANGHLEKTDCENSHLAEKSFEHLLSSPCIEMVHIYGIARLLKKFPEFETFVNKNAFTFPGIRNYGRIKNNELLNLYKQLFTAENEQQQHKNEAILGLCFCLNSIKNKEAHLNGRRKAQFAAIRAEVFAILKLLDIFTENVDDAHSFLRMACPLFKYKQYLNDLSEKPEEAQWKTPYKCLRKDYAQNLQTLRKHMSTIHYEFMSNVVAADDLVKIIRESAGAFKKLQNLIGANGLKIIWMANELREKLLNQNFFVDKKRLLGHYHRSLTNPSKNERTKERLLANLMVIYDCYFCGIRRVSHTIKLRKEIDKEIVLLWLFFRILYDTFYVEMQTDVDVANKLSYASFLQESIVSSVIILTNELTKKNI